MSRTYQSPLVHPWDTGPVFVTLCVVYFTRARYPCGCVGEHSEFCLKNRVFWSSLAYFISWKAYGVLVNLGSYRWVYQNRRSVESFSWIKWTQDAFFELFLLSDDIVLLCPCAVGYIYSCKYLYENNLLCVVALFTVIFHCYVYAPEIAPSANSATVSRDASTIIFYICIVISCFSTPKCTQMEKTLWITNKKTELQSLRIFN